MGLVVRKSRVREWCDRVRTGPVNGAICFVERATVRIGTGLEAIRTVNIGADWSGQG